MQGNNGKSRGLLLLAISVILVVSVAALVILTDHPKTTYWTLYIDAPAGWNVTPNGTIRVPTSQNGVNITVTNVPFGAKGCWRLDGLMYNSSLEGEIFIPKQAADSIHMLDTRWFQPTPQIQPITKGEVTINPGGYEAYNFTVTSDMYAWVFGDVNASANINIYILNEGNFMRWKSGQTADFFLQVNSVTNYIIDNLGLPAGNVCYLVFDNANNTKLCIVNSDVDLRYLNNGLSIQT